MRHSISKPILVVTRVAKALLVAANILASVTSFNLPSTPLSFVFFDESLSSDITLLTSSLRHQKWRGRIKGGSFFALKASKSSSKASILKSTTTDEEILESKPKKGRFDAIFDKRVEEFEEFYAEHGHGAIPSPYPENPQLGVWAANLRRQHKIWKYSEKRNVPYKGYLTEQRRNQLLKIGFDFSSLTERQFQLRLKELKSFKKKYGHVMVPEKYEENMALGAWVSNMRSLYKRKKLLQSGVEIEMDESKPRQTEIVGARKMGRKSNNILQQKITPMKRKARMPRFSHLDDDRIEILENLGFVWSSIDKKWFEMLEWAKVYGVVNYQLSLSSNITGDDCNAANYDRSVEDGGGATDYIDNSQNHTLLLQNYHIFVENLHNNSTLPCFHSQDQIFSLLLDENYAENILHSKYNSRHAMELESELKTSQLDSSPPLDYRVPPNDELHYPLRIWFVNQRSNYHRLHQDEDDPLASAFPSTMTEQRQKALESIHFPWSGRFGNRWDEVEYDRKQQEEMEKQQEKERRKEQRESEEAEKVKQLIVARATAVSAKVTSEAAREIMSEETLDIMDLWNAEDDDDDW